MITLKKNKPDFKKMFDNYIEKSSQYEETNVFGEPAYMTYLVKKYGREDDWDEDESGFLDFGYVKSKKQWKRQRNMLQNFMGLPSKKNKNKGKRGTRGGKKGMKNKVRDLFSEEDMMYDEQMNDKTIYFYRDVNNPDRSEVFYNLYDFDMFLDEEGIEVSEQEVQNLMNREVSHCCVNPDIKATRGTVQLITDSSYGGLYWTSHSDEETETCGSY